MRYFLLVVNASNRQKIVEWIAAQWPDESVVEMQDRTVDTAMLAVQGPAALETLQPLFDFDISAMKYFRAKVTHQMKKLDLDHLRMFRDTLELPIPDDRLEEAPYFHPGAQSDEV